MRLISALIALPALFVPLLSLSAADRRNWNDDSDWQRIDDLRLGYWTMPLTSSIDTQANNVQGYHKDGQLQSGSRVSLQWALPVSDLSSDGGGVLALEVSSTSYHQDQTLVDPEITLTAYALTLHPGFAWALTDSVHLEVDPFLGYGASSVSSGSGQGTFWEYGMRLATYWTIARHFQIGIDLRYLGTYARQNFTYGASSEDVVIKTKGASIGAQIGYRF